LKIGGASAACAGSCRNSDNAKRIADKLHGLVAITTAGTRSDLTGVVTQYINRTQYPNYNRYFTVLTRCPDEPVHLEVT